MPAKRTRCAGRRPLQAAGFVRGVALGAAMVLCATLIHAQGRGGMAGGGGMGGGMPRGTFGGRMPVPGQRNSPPPGGQAGEGNAMRSTMHGGLQLGPPGRWWDDKEFARSVGLDSAQQHRMDEVFGANKENLVKLYKNLQHEESQLGKVVRGKELVETQIFDQIDRVVQARGELEKASAHYLLQIRKEMTPEQMSRLDDHLPTQ